MFGRATIRLGIGPHSSYNRFIVKVVTNTPAAVLRGLECPEQKTTAVTRFDIADTMFRSV